MSACVGMAGYRRCSSQLLLLLLLLLQQQHVSTFVLMPANATRRTADDLTLLNRYVYRWSMPVDTGSNEGLGGGLSWVLDPKFCEQMLPQFPEGAKSSWVGYSFVTCNDILVALARGFATWEANHKHIQFRDVGDTEACANRSAALGDPCAWQLFVGTDDGASYPNLAAYVINHRTSAFPGAFPRWWQETARSPAGVVDAAVDPFQRSVMRFQTHICWYLDATFCYAFHAMQDEHGLDVVLIMRLVLFSLFLLAICGLGGFVVTAARTLLRTPLRNTEAETRREIERVSSHVYALSGIGQEGPRREATAARRRCRALLDYLAGISPLTMICVLFLLVFPPIFYDQIFLPCWDCYDFEAAIAHEVGHVLGFDHPDTSPHENLEQVGNLSNATCRSPWSVAQLTDYTQTEGGSIMHSLTRHNPVTCLSASDVNGLYLLYPVCDEYIPTDVSCSKATRLSGFLRLASVVGLPLLIAVVVVLLPLSCLRWRDARRIKSLTKDVEEAGSAMRTLRRLSRMGAALRPASSSRRGNRVAPLSSTAVDAAVATILAFPTAGGVRTGMSNGNPQLLTVEELDTFRDSAGGALEPKPQQAGAPFATPHHASAQAARRSAFADMLGGSGKIVYEGAPGAPAESEPTRTPL